MKSLVVLVFASVACSVAWADVQIKYKDMTGATNTMRSNGLKARINGGQMPGYLLIDGSSGEYFVVDKKRKEVIRIAPEEVSATVEVGKLNVSLKPRGSGDKIAGYSTGRFDLLANGEFCGSVNGSSKLIKNPELKRMFEAMQGMHKISRSMMAGMGQMLSACQRANLRLADLAETSGFVLRATDEQGNINFEVVSLKTDKKVDPKYYEVPTGMTVIDMNEKMEQASKQMKQMKQQMPEMDEMMQQFQENGGEMTPEMQQQMKQMMEQLQKMQPE